MTQPVPWQYAGSKRRAASYVWRALGDVKTYIEPFAGSLAVMLGRPLPVSDDGKLRIEIANDANGSIVNLLRALQSDPQGVWRKARWTRTTIDLAARNNAIIAAHADLIARLTADPDWFDPDLAAYQYYTLLYATHPAAAINGNPSLGRPSMNGSARMPVVEAMAARLNRTRLSIMCGDWSKAVTPALTESAPVGVFLDPPYLSGNRDKRLYGLDQDDGRGAAASCRQWAITRDDHRKWRIVLAGYVDEGCPPGWTEVFWSSNQGGESRHDERLWLSPGCMVQAADTRDVLALQNRPTFKDEIG